VRGSGGNLGIVTSLQYRLHEVGPVLGGGVFYPVRQAQEVLRFYREITQDIPDELVLQAAALDLPGVEPVIAIAACYSGPLAEGEKVLQPIRKFGAPVADIIAPISFVQMQSLFDPFFPPGRHVYVKSNFIAELSDGAIEVLSEYAETRPSPHSLAPAIEHWHGAATRVPVTETAFPHRKHSYNFMAWSVWEDSRDTEKNLAWTRKFWEDLRPYLVAGSYGNYVSDEGDATARAAYGENYERLVTLKNKYDPTNFFPMNHNIRPTV
jgi:FAD/FMN-containing dehydrogenase